MVFRAVAQYLKRQSSVTPITESASEDLSLNKLLKGKTRTLCARMFFETLVIIGTSCLLCTYSSRFDHKLVNPDLGEKWILFNRFTVHIPIHLGEKKKKKEKGK